VHSEADRETRKNSEKDLPSHLETSLFKNPHPFTSSENFGGLEKKEKEPRLTLSGVSFLLRTRPERLT